MCLSTIITKHMEVFIMPAKDGTGPLGKGPMTGRGLGPCNKGKKVFRGRGLGRGKRWLGQEDVEE